MLRKLCAAFAGVCMLGAGSANALVAPIAGTEGEPFVVNTNGNLIATYLGKTATFNSDLYLFTDDGVDDNDIFIFNNQVTPFGAMVDLGSFAMGTELIFRMFVSNAGRNYFTGSASRNSDGIAHARVQSAFQPGVTLVGFEDIYGGGDRDFNDLVFSVEEEANVVPIPAAGLLLLTGLAGAAGARRFRKNAA